MNGRATGRGSHYIFTQERSHGVMSLADKDGGGIILAASLASASLMHDPSALDTWTHTTPGPLSWVLRSCVLSAASWRQLLLLARGPSVRM